MKKKTFFFLLLFSILSLSACTAKSTSTVENMPGIDIPGAEFNTKIVILNFPDNPPTYKNSDAPTFLIKNRSGDIIAFAQDFGVKIFEKQGTLWEQIENKWGYPDGENLLPTQQNFPPGLAFFVFPDVGDLKGSTTVRIVVIGHVKDQPAEQVAAYIDVKYIP